MVGIGWGLVLTDGNHDMAIADIVIPVGPYHTEVAKEAIASAYAQAYPVQVFPVYDTEGRGAAWARNQGARQGVAPFIVFLDADDLLREDYLEKTLQTYQEQTYVYTDWQTFNGRVRYADQRTNFFKVGMYHIITTLLPRAAFEYVGGFDETLPALEDEDLYYKLQINGICGIRCAEPLVYYRRQFGRGKVNSVYFGEQKRDETVRQMEQIFAERYGQYRRLYNMCACGNKAAPRVVVGRDKQDGDVLALALYESQRMPGPASKRMYALAGQGDEMWIHPDDAAARPDLWRILPRIDTPSTQDIVRMAVGQ
jgi:glycosyltransferase involved in cell wall biosynthesis